MNQNHPLEPEELENQFVLQDLYYTLNLSASGTEDEGRRRDLYTAATMVRIIALTYNLEYNGSQRELETLSEVETVLKNYYCSAKESLEEATEEELRTRNIDHVIISFIDYICLVLQIDKTKWTC